MKGIVADIAAGLGAGVVLLVFLLLLRAGIPVSIGAGALAYAGFALLLPKAKKKAVFVAEGVTAEQVARVLGEVRVKVAAIEAASRKIDKQTVREQVLEIHALSAKIIDDLEKDPRSFKNARKFLNYYLDATEYILSRYAQLREGAVYSENVQLTLIKVEDSLTLIQQTFAKQMERLLQDDVDDLDVELERLAKTIRTEGI